MKIFVLVCLALASSFVVADEPRKNILFIMTDDQAPWATGAFEGATHADTPHLDKLFKQGTYLPNTFVVTPVCSPSRASLATSLYGSEVGITDWLNPKVEPEHGLDPATSTWYEAVHNAGYHTGLVGKWHLGLLDHHHPTQTGFDYFMGHRGGGWSPDNPTLEKDGSDQKFKGLTTDILADHAIEFLNDRPTDKPFLLVLHFRAPHARWLPVAPEDWAPFENLKPDFPHPDYPGLDKQRLARMTREYLASVRGVDRNVGRLLQTVDDLKLADDTVVVFTSDHGYNMGHNGIWHKGNGHWILKKDALPAGTKNIPKGQRPNMYDASLKVPTAIRWPGVTKPGSTVKTCITQLDWFPTMIGIANAKAPQDSVLRGRDLKPLLTGKAKDWDEEVFAQYSTKHQTRTHMRCLRTPEWKLVRDFMHPERDELYHLTTDPEETTNVIDEPANQAIVKQLHSKLLKRMEEIHDPQAE
ncbi:sulfatase family protein [Fuerstiella marisgermanici]|uniref:Choline-sulfatase n=1 Tax=Fuerstiella marisgermanici TaxID=1891926 RepID=A0A1P8WHT2_9PLAN|nr:sulfatase-like hydrolase/transferase [Fuerstiella marisgermanici]APZ93608.1 Choline-sulfatase [Fuerstiella marisgermanici]